MSPPILYRPPSLPFPPPPLLVEIPNVNLPDCIGNPPIPQPIHSWPCYHTGLALRSKYFTLTYTHLPPLLHLPKRSTADHARLMLKLLPTLPYDYIISIQSVAAV